MSELTIIVPIYNEEDGLQRLSEALSNYSDQSQYVISILLINDGSSDTSLDKIKRIAAENPNFDYISFSKNQGLSAAIKAGIDHVTTPYIGYIDADLQTSPEDFDILMEQIDQFDAVVGYRAKRKDTWNKKIQSKIANGIRRRLINDGIIDTGCPLKVMRTEVAKKIPFFTGMHRFIPALIQLQGGKVQQVPVQHFERQEGQSKFNLLNRSIGPMMDTLVFRWMKNRHINYEVDDKSL